MVRSDGRIIAVSAFAGTGKTTTLVRFARARPTRKILYLAFIQACFIAPAAGSAIDSYGVTLASKH